MKIALAQINTKVGDLDGNTKIIIQNINAAKKMNADIVIFPELSITGYPPRDLLDFECFIDDNLKYLQKIREHARDISVIVGYIDKNPSSEGRKYFNAAALIENTRITAKYYKRLLPFYDIFDETRYFEPGKDNVIIKIKDKKLALTICEDLWNDKDYWKRAPYHINPAEEIIKLDVEGIINISASPYVLNKEKERFAVMKNIGLPVIYVNQAGGNDDLIFDGASFAMDKNGEITALCHQFREDLAADEIRPLSNIEEESVFNALCLGLSDYCRKTGFKKVVIGLSGGIDSAVTAAIAAHALGKENVLGITMPGMYSSAGSVSDSEKLSQNLGIGFKEIPIKEIFDCYIKGDKCVDLAEENLQARIRANILMIHSNRYGSLLLTTGNKSELAVGYCTLYGDMCGGLAVLSDTPKVMVYRLANYINRNREIIPRQVITKPPSAELKPDQKDQDTLPPYELLDAILKEFIEENRSIKEISKKYPGEVVRDMVKKINASEYKRRQAALGLKVTSRAFGTGRRFPVVQGYDFEN